MLHGRDHHVVAWLKTSLQQDVQGIGYVQCEDHVFWCGEVKELRQQLPGLIDHLIGGRRSVVTTTIGVITDLFNKVLERSAHPWCFRVGCCRIIQVDPHLGPPPSPLYIRRVCPGIGFPYEWQGSIGKPYCTTKPSLDYNQDRYCEKNYKRSTNSTGRAIDLGDQRNIILAGGLVGLLSVILVHFGNPANMGICIVCFIRDTAGGLGLHRASAVQYIRPELIGIALGAWLMALGSGDFKARGGSSPFTRFILGFFVVIGALMFLGCPLRMVLRMAGGDLTAILGLVGFAVGISIGVVFLNKGFTLRRTYSLNKAEGFLFPAMQVAFLLLLVIAPVLVYFSTSGPGSMHAPIAISLIAGLLVGVAAQRTRLCMVGGIRDLIMFRDAHLISGFLAILVVAFVGALLTGNFNLGFEGQPVAHNDGLWNFLGMVLAGLGSVLLGGCPLRQIILAAEGNIDSAVTLIGMLVGAAFAHNFGLASSGAGPTTNGQVAVIIGLVAVLVIGIVNTSTISEAVMKGDVKLDA